MPTKKNRKQSFKSAQRAGAEGKTFGDTIGKSGRETKSEFPTQKRDTTARVIKLRK